MFLQNNHIDGVIQSNIPGITLDDIYVDTNHRTCRNLFWPFLKSGTHFHNFYSPTGVDPREGDSLQCQPVEADIHVIDFCRENISGDQVQ